MLKRNLSKFTATGLVLMIFLLPGTAVAGETAPEVGWWARIVEFFEDLLNESEPPSPDADFGTMGDPNG